MDLTPGGATTTRVASMSYQDFVLNRLRDLVAGAHRPVAGDGQPAKVHRRLAVPELVALGVLAVALLVSLLA